MRGRVVEGERDEGVQKKNEWERKDCREGERKKERGREMERRRENHTQIVSTLLKPKGEIHCAHRMYSHRIMLERTSLSY